MIKINIFFTAFLITLFAFGKSLSQDWFNYSDEEWFFSVNFPNEPEIEEIIYASEWGGFYPGRVYTAEHNNHFYSLKYLSKLLRFFPQINSAPLSSNNHNFYNNLHFQIDDCLWTLAMELLQKEYLKMIILLRLRRQL